MRKLFIHFFLASILLLTFQHNSFGQTYRLNKNFGPYNFGPVRVLAVSPDGNLLASNGINGDINIIEADSGKIIKTLKGHGQRINSIFFSANNKYLLSASADGSVKIWNIKKGELIKTYNPDPENNVNNPITFADFGKADNEVIFGGGNKQLYSAVHIYDQKKTDLHTVFTTPQPISAGLFSPDKTYFIFSSGNLLYIKRDGQAAPSIFGTASEEITFLTISPDGKLIAGRCKNGLIDIWSTEKGNKLKTFKSASQTTEDNFTQLSFSDDGKYLVTGSNDGMPTVWDVEDSKSLFDLFGHKGKVIPVLFTGENKVIVSGSDDGSIKVWQILKKKEKAENDTMKKNTTDSAGTLPNPDLTFASGEDTLPSSLAGRNVVSTNPKPLVVSSRSITIYVWDDDQADGDIVSLNLNGKWVLEKYQLNKKKKIINVKLQPYKNNYLLLYAHNEGKIPPNTAGISIFDGFSETKLNLKSDLKSSDAVKLILK